MVKTLNEIEAQNCSTITETDSKMLTTLRALARIVPRILNLMSFVGPVTDQLCAIFRSSTALLYLLFFQLCYWMDDLDIADLDVWEIFRSVL